MRNPFGLLLTLSVGAMPSHAMMKAKAAPSQNEKDKDKEPAGEAQAVERAPDTPSPWSSRRLFPSLARPQPGTPDRPGMANRNRLASLPEGVAVASFAGSPHLRPSPPLAARAELFALAARPPQTPLRTSPPRPQPRLLPLTPTPAPLQPLFQPVPFPMLAGSPPSPLTLPARQPPSPLTITVVDGPDLGTITFLAGSPGIAPARPVPLLLPSPSISSTASSMPSPGGLSSGDTPSPSRSPSLNAHRRQASFPKVVPGKPAPPALDPAPPLDPRRARRSPLLGPLASPSLQETMKSLHLQDLNLGAGVQAEPPLPEDLSPDIPPRPELIPLSPVAAADLPSPTCNTLVGGFSVPGSPAGAGAATTARPEQAPSAPPILGQLDGRRPPSPPTPPGVRPAPGRASLQPTPMGDRAGVKAKSLSQHFCSEGEVRVIVLGHGPLPKHVSMESGHITYRNDSDEPLLLAEETSEAGPAEAEQGPLPANVPGGLPEPSVEVERHIPGRSVMGFYAPPSRLERRFTVRRSNLELKEVLVLVRAQDFETESESSQSEAEAD